MLSGDSVSIGGCFGHSSVFQESNGSGNFDMNLGHMEISVMPISVICECGMKSLAPNEAAGKHGRCPQCRARIAIPFPNLVVDHLKERRGVIFGSPGQAWVNDTGQHQWQLFAVVHPGYGRCFQSWTHLYRYGGLPFCDECKCIQKLVKPGQTVFPFIDLSAELVNTTAPGRRSLIL
jgi:hypothetical protein